MSQILFFFFLAETQGLSKGTPSPNAGNPNHLKPNLIETFRSAATKTLSYDESSHRINVRVGKVYLKPTPTDNATGCSESTRKSQIQARGPHSARSCNSDGEFLRRQTPPNSKRQMERLLFGFTEHARCTVIAIASAGLCRPSYFV